MERGIAARDGVLRVGISWWGRPEWGVMTRLEIRLLGPFAVTIDGVPVTDFESDSARGLLA